MGMTEGQGIAGTDEGASRTIADAVWLAVLAGLMIGLGEAFGVGWRSLVLGRVTRVTPQIVWMAPTVYAAFFVFLALPLVLVIRVPRQRALRAVSALVLTLGLVGWIGMLPWTLHPVGIWFLAAGMGWKLAERVARLDPGVAVVRRLVGGLVIFVVAAAGVSGLAVWRAERRALASRPPAPEAPNVLLIILDTVRAKSLGMYGGEPDVSPWLDEFGAESIVFDHARSTAPWTLPSHASMFTGRWPHELSSGWDRPLDASVPTLAESLEQRGYITGGFVANLLYTSRPMGLSRGFSHYEDYPIDLGQMILATSLGRQVSTMDWLRSLLNRHQLLNRRSAAEVSAGLLDWLDELPDRPFFAFLNLFDAHEPYEPSPALRQNAAPQYRRSNMVHRQDLLRGVSARRIDKWAMTSDEILSELTLYEAMITEVDGRLRQLFEELERRGALANTLVIITSDHGEQMGEHGMFGHLQSLYSPLTHVPLIISTPGGDDTPLRVDRPVSLRDLAATILDIVDLPGPDLPGSSLAATWDGTLEPQVSLAVSELGRGLAEQPWYPIATGLDMQSLQSGTLFYICNPDASEELYDLASDPAEERNLALTPAGVQAVRAFRNVIASVEAPPRWCPPENEAPPRAPSRTR